MIATRLIDARHRLEDRVEGRCDRTSVVLAAAMEHHDDDLEAAIAGAKKVVEKQPTNPVPDDGQTFESLQENELMEGGFTGTIRDKAGAKRTYADGKQVANSEKKSAAPKSSSKTSETATDGKAGAEKTDPKQKPGTQEKASRTLGKEAIAVSDGHKASDTEIAEARSIAGDKIKNVPVPPKEAVIHNRKRLDLHSVADKEWRTAGGTKSGKPRPQQRSFLDLRLSQHKREPQSKEIFKEFGGEKKGYVVCHATGQKLHWADKSDKENNPNGYEKFEKGKIFTARQGGGYQNSNILPESLARAVEGGAVGD